MLWKVRFKFKQMMETHVIETIGTSQEEADELAEAYLGDEFGTPNIRLVPPVLPFVSRKTIDVPALAQKYGPIAPIGTPMPITPPTDAPPATPPPPAEPVPDSSLPAADPDDEMTAMAGSAAVTKVNRASKPRIGA